MCESEMQDIGGIREKVVRNEMIMRWKEENSASDERV